jgi:hypothetical protein
MMLFDRQRLGFSGRVPARPVGKKTVGAFARHRCNFQFWPLIAHRLQARKRLTFGAMERA